MTAFNKRLDAWKGTLQSRGTKHFPLSIILPLKLPILREYGIQRVTDTFVCEPELGFVGKPSLQLPKEVYDGDVRSQRSAQAFYSPSLCFVQAYDLIAMIHSVPAHFTPLSLGDHRGMKSTPCQQVLSWGGGGVGVFLLRVRWKGESEFSEEPVDVHSPPSASSASRGKLHYHLSGAYTYEIICFL
jgi:hypothetical protein